MGEVVGLLVGLLVAVMVGVTVGERVPAAATAIVSGTAGIDVDNVLPFGKVGVWVMAGIVPVVGPGVPARVGVWVGKGVAGVTVGDCTDATGEEAANCEGAGITILSRKSDLGLCCFKSVSFA